MAEVRLLGERVEVTLPVLLLEFPFLPHVIPPTVLKNPLLKTPTESRVEWWPRCRRLEEGERKRGWRKRKEENGVQAPNRAEIILDHKGWNSIENLGYSKNCQSIVEKGKRPDEQDVGVEGQVQVLTAWPEKKRRVNDTLSLIFFLKNTSSPVNVMEKWKNSWQEGEMEERLKKKEGGEWCSSSQESWNHPRPQRMEFYRKSRIF